MITVTAPVISGRVFEDVSYGGGAGRSLAASSGVLRPGARVELYAGSGGWLGADTTDALGVYAFDGWAPGSYTVNGGTPNSLASTQSSTSAGALRPQANGSGSGT